MGLHHCTLYGVHIASNKKRLPKNACHLDRSSIKFSVVNSSKSELFINSVKDDEFGVSPPDRSTWRRSSSIKRVKVKPYERNINKNNITSNSSLIIPWSPPLVSSASSGFVWPGPITKILPHLFLGAYENAINEVHVKENNITHILSLIGHRSPLDFVKHAHFPMNDYGRTDVKQVLISVSKFMKEGQKDGNNVLVHCQSGQNRSPTVVIAWLMMNHKKTLWRAHREVKKLRPLVHVNESYAKQLLELEKEIFNKNSLPPEWMERGQFDEDKGEVTYLHEFMDTAQHLVMFNSDTV